MKKLLKTTMLLIVGWSLLLVAGCDASIPQEGYKVRISDGWVSNYFDCHTYIKDGQNLQCFNKAGEKIIEVFMPSDMRFTISKYGN